MIQSEEEEHEREDRLDLCSTYPNLVTESIYGDETGEDGELVGGKILGEDCPAVKRRNRW